VLPEAGFIGMWLGLPRWRWVSAALVANGRALLPALISQPG